MLEARAAGRWFEIAQDGTRTAVATVLDWEPPNRVVFQWQVDAKLQFDKDMKTEVDIRFRTDVGTVVDLTHGRFDLMDIAQAQLLRNKLEQIWPMALNLFVARAELEAIPL